MVGEIPQGYVTGAMAEGRRGEGGGDMWEEKSGSCLLHSFHTFRFASVVTTFLNLQPPLRASELAAL